MRNPTLAQDMFREGCTDTALFQERVGQTVLNQHVCAETEQVSLSLTCARERRSGSLYARINAIVRKLRM